MAVFNDESKPLEILPMLELEARLGFHFNNGISKTKGARSVPLIAELLNRIRRLSVQYVQLPRGSFSQSHPAKAAVEELFNDLGPKLWPSDDEACPSWLFDEGRDGDRATTLLRRQLPARLHYDRESEQTRLRHAFTTMVMKKCLRYMYNHRPQSTSSPRSGKRKRKALIQSPTRKRCTPSTHQTNVHAGPGQALARFLTESRITIFMEDKQSHPCDHFCLAGLFTGSAFLDELSSRLKDELETVLMTHVLVKGGWEAEELPVLVPIRRGEQSGGWEDVTKLMCEKHGAKGVRLIGYIMLRTTGGKPVESMDGEYEYET